jgi:mRNA interferase RelE/StbE
VTLVEIRFTDAAIDDLRRLGRQVAVRVIKKVLLLADNAEAGQPLGGELTGYRKLVVRRNTWRVVYRVTDDGAVEVCEVSAVGARADAEVYAEAVQRVRAAAEHRPALAQLADALAQIGKLTGDVEARLAVSPKLEPVPDWLADRLVYTVGLRREEVAALDLRGAVDRWTAYVSGSSPKASGSAVASTS